MRPSERWVALSIALALLAAPRAAKPADRPPNIIVILADDLGIGDVCAYGACDAGRATPNLDALAASGIRFTSGYVAAPICSPSRAALMTGRYQQRFGHEFNPDGIERGQSQSLGTPVTEILFPTYLEPRGYASGIIGKWHLGPAPPQNPVVRGFDEFFGFLHGAKLYYPTVDEPGIHQIAEAPVKGKEKTEQNPLNPMMRGREPTTEPGYLTDAFAREAVSFIERHRAQPFFLYVPFNAPHTPLMVDDERYDRFAGVGDETHRIHAAMMGALDDGVGKIVAALRSADLLEDTLIFFISDNGCPTNIAACSNADLRGGKRVLFEGGINVPFLASWPGTIAPGRVVDEPVITLDLLPTALELAGVKPPTDRELDGRSLAPLLRGKVESLGREALFWRHGTNWAVRAGSMKLIGFSGHAPLLFDLASEAGESRDLATAKADVVASLERLYRAWESKLVEPLWDSGGSIWVSLDDLMAGKPMKPIKGPPPHPGAVEIP
ncbi:MAG TPA: sulfatase-like hydrolase/transferase [Thermoanaerobaculia bacterium]|nr:sulfatase-like hydrolase/transferase [Thermoanaerobaculia bacterium]